MNKINIFLLLIALNLTVSCATTTNTFSDVQTEIKSEYVSDPNEHEVLEENGTKTQTTENSNLRNVENTLSKSNEASKYKIVKPIKAD